VNLLIPTTTLLATALPFALVAWFGLSRPVSRVDWYVRIAVVGAFSFAAYVAIPWGRTSYYLRAILVLALAVASVRAFVRTVDRAAPSGRSRLHDLLLLLAACLGIVTASALRSPSEGIDLEFPLASGTFYVIQGGSHILVNPFHRTGATQQEAHALDIVQLNGLGGRAAGLYPHRLESYVIFGAPVISPCSGTVAAAVSGRVNTPVGARGVHPGNQVLLRCQGALITLAHLAPRLAVRAGDRVRSGQLIGYVGNSGRSSEPHLHIDALREEGLVPLPMKFDGRTLMLNSVVRK
jgi:hypothetical protein